MSRITFHHDDSATIECECPAQVDTGGRMFEACGADVEVTRSAAGLYTVPKACPCGDHGEYHTGHIAALKEAAEYEFDNYDGGDYETPTSGSSAAEVGERMHAMQRDLKR